MKKNNSKLEELKLYFWILSYFKPFVLMTSLYIICGGVMIWGELMIPRRMGYLIDKVLPVKDIEQLKEQMIILGAIIVLILVVKAIYNLLEQIVSKNIVKNQQMDLMKKLQELGFSYYEKVPTGEILSLFENAVKETQQTYVFLFPHFIYALAQFVVPSIILLSNEPIFFGAAMVGNVIYVFINQTANKKIRHYLDLESKAAHILQQSLYDVIVARNEIAVNGSQDWFVKKTMKDYDDYRKPRMASVFWRHFRFTTVGLTLTISVGLFYVFGLEIIKSGDLLIGEFVGYSFLMGLISRGFSVFFYIIPAQLQALSYGKYLYEFLNIEPKVKGPIDGLEVAYEQSDIQFKNVSFSYDNKQTIISDLSVRIPKGKKTAIVGESGCGKSTLLKLIGRFYDVTKGELIVGQCNVKNLDVYKLRERIGFVFQDTYLFDMSIMDNIRFGKLEASDEEVIGAAVAAGAHGFITETENGYETIVGERGFRLSGGQKQRISIARMILKNPQFILLDEATSALDNVTETYVKEAIDQLSEGKTIVAVAHRLSTIADYDNIICLESGKIVEQGTYEELMNQKGCFYNLVLKGGSEHVA